ncbi:hypothetical protein WA158_007490 [Blastocystis sp. Blastoise]
MDKKQEILSENQSHITFICCDEQYVQVPKQLLEQYPNSYMTKAWKMHSSIEKTTYDCYLDQPANDITLLLQFVQDYYLSLDDYSSSVLNSLFSLIINYFGFSFENHLNKLSQILSVRFLSNIKNHNISIYDAEKWNSNDENITNFYTYFTNETTLNSSKTYLLKIQGVLNDDVYSFLNDYTCNNDTSLLYNQLFSSKYYALFPFLQGQFILSSIYTNDGSEGFSYFQFEPNGVKRSATDSSSPSYRISKTTYYSMTSTPLLYNILGNNADNTIDTLDLSRVTSLDRISFLSAILPKHYMQLTTVILPNLQEDLFKEKEIALLEQCSFFQNIETLYISSLCGMTTKICPQLKTVYLLADYSYDPSLLYQYITSSLHPTLSSIYIESMYCRNDSKVWTLLLKQNVKLFVTHAYFTQNLISDHSLYNYIYNGFLSIKEDVAFTSIYYLHHEDVYTNLFSSNLLLLLLPSIIHIPTVIIKNCKLLFPLPCLLSYIIKNKIYIEENDPEEFIQSKILSVSLLFENPSLPVPSWNTIPTSTTTTTTGDTNNICQNSNQENSVPDVEYNSFSFSTFNFSLPNKQLILQDIEFLNFDSDIFSRFAVEGYFEDLQEIKYTYNSSIQSPEDFLSLFNTANNDKLGGLDTIEMISEHILRQPVTIPSSSSISLPHSIRYLTIQNIFLSEDTFIRLFTSPKRINYQLISLNVTSCSLLDNSIKQLAKLVETRKLVHLEDITIMSNKFRRPTLYSLLSVINKNTIPKLSSLTISYLKEDSNDKRLEEAFSADLMKIFPSLSLIIRRLSR